MLDPHNRKELLLGCLAYQVAGAFFTVEGPLGAALALFDSVDLPVMLLREPQGLTCCEKTIASQEP